MGCLKVLFIHWAQGASEFVQSISIAACCRMRRDVEGFGNLNEGEVLPQFKVKHCPLFLREVFERGLNGLPKFGVIAWKQREKQIRCFA